MHVLVVRATGEIELHAARFQFIQQRKRAGNHILYRVRFAASQIRKAVLDLGVQPIQVHVLVHQRIFRLPAAPPI